MPELTSKQKRKAREFLKQTKGDKCFFCSKTGDEYRKEKGRDFDIHHHDRNRENNPPDGSNWELACHSCNCKNDPRGVTTKPKFSGFKNLKNRININKHTKKYGQQWSNQQLEQMPSQMRASYDYKQMFPKVLEIILTSEEALIEINGEKVVTQEDVIESSAKEIGCSQEVALKYLKEECSIFGEYERLGLDENDKIKPIRFLQGYKGKVYVRKKKQ